MTLMCAEYGLDIYKRQTFLDVNVIAGDVVEKLASRQWLPRDESITTSSRRARLASRSDSGIG